MSEQKNPITRALLVNVISSSFIDFQSNELEFKELVKSGQMLVASSINCRLNKKFINPKYLIRQGQLSNILSIVNSEDIDLVIFNYDISASQQKHLEEFLKCKVLDRTELILHIFAQRARTFEGKLQVELARLEHLSTRLVRVWTHLERQRGGVGLRGGPGEKQLEIDRRIIKNRITKIKQKLEQIKKQRRLHRNSRKKSGLSTISLVGYTNSGKSTLFNLLTNAKVETLDLPFVTLDPTTRSIMVPKIGKVILNDTVGFIKDLPHELIAAFKATLEEINASDLLLHVIDISDQESIERRQQVLKVLEQIGISGSEIPILEVYNKIDKSSVTINPDFSEILNINADPDLKLEVTDKIKINFIGKYGVKISALHGVGIDDLLQEISKFLNSSVVKLNLNLLPKDFKIRTELINLDAIDQENLDPITGEFKLEVSLNKQAWDLLCNKFIDLPKMVMP